MGTPIVTSYVNREIFTDWAQMHGAELHEDINREGICATFGDTHPQEGGAVSHDGTSTEIFFSVEQQEIIHSSTREAFESGIGLCPSKTVTTRVGVEELEVDEYDRLVIMSGAQETVIDVM
jgi:hypothetical protein